MVIEQQAVSLIPIQTLLAHLAFRYSPALELPVDRLPLYLDIMNSNFRSWPMELQDYVQYRCRSEGGARAVCQAVADWVRSQPERVSQLPNAEIPIPNGKS